MTELFTPASLEDHHKLLADHAPYGKLWQAVYDKEDDFGKIFLGLSKEFQRFQELEKKLFDEMNIRKTSELLSDWEASMELPNKCIQISETDDRRRLQIEQHFTRYGGVQKKEDFIRVAAFFKIAIQIQTGDEEGSIVDLKERKHTMFVTIFADNLGVLGFPLEFAIQFKRGAIEFLQCLFNELAPANVATIIDGSDAYDIFYTESEEVMFTESGNLLTTE